MDLLIKYIIVYGYLSIVMILAFLISKLFLNNEISRNIIHICAGTGWIIYKLLFPATIHPIIISSSFVLLTIITKKTKVSFIERNNDTLGTIFFTVSMLVMSVIGYKSHLLFDIFGIAIICLSFGDASANIIGSRFGRKYIYKKKSLQGTIACLVASAFAMIMLKYLFSIKLSFAAIGFLAILCSITELFASKYDNVAIPTIIYLTAYIILNDLNISNLLISIGIGVLMFGIAIKYRLLSVPASCVLFYSIFILYYYGGIKSFISLIFVFTIIISVEKFLHRKTKSIFKSMNKEYGMRNERQLIANCLFAVISIAAYGISKNEIYIVVFFAAISEAVGDSISSDIGVLSKNDPIDICSFKRIPKGASGGISILGTMASVIVCMYAGLIYFFIYETDLYKIFIIFISSFSGIILDSILGSKIQAQYKCVACKKVTEKEFHCEIPTVIVKGYECFDNTRVNFICNMFSCGMAFLIMIMR